MTNKPITEDHSRPPVGESITYTFINGDYGEIFHKGPPFDQEWVWRYTDGVDWLLEQRNSSSWESAFKEMCEYGAQFDEDLLT